MYPGEQPACIFVTPIIFQKLFHPTCIFSVKSPKINVVNIASIFSREDACSASEVAAPVRHMQPSDTDAYMLCGTAMESWSLSITKATGRFNLYRAVHSQRVREQYALACCPAAMLNTDGPAPFPHRTGKWADLFRFRPGNNSPAFWTRYGQLASLLRVPRWQDSTPSCSEDTLHLTGTYGD